ncbi:MAG TPA: hypothetical protein VD948_13005 [Rhodothermales bacterium]|nr:hypothetical protein [Rhodothermales bacterium]
MLPQGGAPMGGMPLPDTSKFSPAPMLTNSLDASKLQGPMGMTQPAQGGGLLGMAEKVLPSVAGMFNKQQDEPLPPPVPMQGMIGQRLDSNPTIQGGQARRRY